MSKLSHTLTAVAVGAILSAAAGPAVAVDLQLTPSLIDFEQPIGIDWQAPDKLILSEHYPSGLPYNFDRINPSNGDSQQAFGGVSGLLEEVQFGTVWPSACLSGSGFALGDVYSGNGVAGQILRISADGTTVQNPWLTLSGETDLIRGSIFQDRFGVAGCDLIVATSSAENDVGGNVYRVTSGRDYTKIAAFSAHLEGLTTLPNRPALYGPAAGRILVGADEYIVAINPNAPYDFFTIGGPGTTGIAGHTHYGTNVAIDPEDLDVIPWGATFYGVAYMDGVIYQAPASDFANFCGQLLITKEFVDFDTSGLLAMHWDGTANNGSGAFVTHPLTADVSIGQWEQVTFAGGTGCPTTGRMTGGGSIFTGAEDSTRVTHGFALRCDASDKRQSLEINWRGDQGSNNFHLTGITKAICVDDPAIQPQPPNASIDTYVGEGVGTCNGQPATISFVFTDAGEPGTSDTAKYHIAGACTLDTVQSLLNKGNHQAHRN